MLPISVIGILHGCIPSGQNTPSPLSPAMYYDCKAVQAHLHQDRPPLARNEFLHFLPTLPPRAAAHRRAVVRQSWLSGCFLPGGPDAGEGRGGKWTTQATMVTGRGFEAEQVCVK